ncbi:MAG TPA: chemotaxis protein CheW [Gemmatimonadales bacterium]|nr:chemotaxis protein CheW [Gemmatimonadales bacterium]
MADPARVRLVIFQVADLCCALPVETIREIIPAQPATRIPGAPDVIDGLINVRGSLLTVARGAAVLQRIPVSLGNASVLVLALEGRSVGLEVDEVLDLVEVDSASLNPAERMPGVDPALVRAVGRHADRVFILLDPGALVAPLVGG